MPIDMNFKDGQRNEVCRTCDRMRFVDFKTRTTDLPKECIAPTTCDARLLSGKT